jgi:penicillin-binding protein 1A
MLRTLAKFIAGLFGLSVLAVITAAVAVWMYLIPELPETESLKNVRFQVPMRIFSADDKLMAEFGEKRRVPLEIDDIPEPLVAAILASEDQHFFTHPGVDWRGLARAVWHLVRTGRKGPGGSTITMQVARNFFLGREKTYLRKLNEILLSFKIEHELSKGEILELYVNKIFLGNRAYGVGAAAEVYYGRPVEDLTLPEMAMIAGLPQRPSDYNPIVNPDRAKTRRNYVLRRMRDIGAIDDATLETAIDAPITARLHRPEFELQAPYVAEMVRAEMEERIGPGAYTDGYRVVTTIDSSRQRAAIAGLREALLAYDRRHGFRGPEVSAELTGSESVADLERLVSEIPIIGGLHPAVVTRVGERDAQLFVKGHGEVALEWAAIEWARKHIDENRRGPKPKTAADVLAAGHVVRARLTEDGWQLAQVPDIEGGFVALDPNDGSIEALTGGFDFLRSKFNRAIQAKRQPGSNFKPFIYTAALEKGFTPASLINDAPVVFDDPGLEADWRPENYSGKFFGPTRIRWALTKSRNLVSIRLLRAIGIDYALEFAGAFGLPVQQLPRNLSLALGSGSLSPMEVATGYGVLANGGYELEPFLIDTIENWEGRIVYKANPLIVCRDCPEPESGKDVERSSPASNPSDSAPPPGGASTVADAPQGVSPNGISSAQESVDGAAQPDPRIAKRVIPEGTAWLMGSMLRDVITRGTGRKALSLKRKDIAGKTGTTNDQRDAWFSGFNAALVATAWVGFDDLKPLGRRETGGRAALPMWISFMGEALAGVPDTIAPKPAELVTVRIDSRTGLLATAESDETMFETFRSEFAPKPQSQSQPGVATSIDQTTEQKPGVAQVPNTTAERVQGQTERLF